MEKDTERFCFSKLNYWLLWSGLSHLIGDCTITGMDIFNNLFEIFVCKGERVEEVPLFRNLDSVPVLVREDIRTVLLLLVLRLIHRILEIIRVHLYVLCSQDMFII